jgi:hypothetical protein
LFSVLCLDIYFVIYSCNKENNVLELKMAYTSSNSTSEGGSGNVWSSGSRGGKFQ